jgi:ribosomal protein S12 methylthiotransferase
MKKQLKIAFVSLGCPKNTVDSEVMLARLAQHGFILTADEQRCDIVVVNTCGFISDAKNEALGELLHFAGQRRKGKIKLLVAAGCLVERDKEKLLEAVPEIDCLVGLANRDEIAEIISASLREKHPSIDIGAGKSFVSDDRIRMLTTLRGSAYLRISDGCDKKCAFCTIPSIRGNFRSKPPELVVEEAKLLLDSGVKEVNLIAQDSNFYGRDLGMKDGLCELLIELDKLDFIWIRVLYMYPSTISDRLIDTIAQSRHIVPYIDMPIQHINNDILRSMRRTDTRENTTSLIERLRAKLPGLVLRTTVITGFPGETVQQHNELVEFMKWAKFDALGCFLYSAEDGTPAAELSGQLDEETKKNRLDEIMTVQSEIACEKNAVLTGSVLEVLSEAVVEGGTIARYYGQAPEIDGVVKVPDVQVEAGEFFKVRVVCADGYDLIAEPE